MTSPNSPITLKRIRATELVFGAGPGMGGTSYIEFLPEEQSYGVFVGGTAFDYREKIGTIKKESSWRDKVKFILSHSEPSHDDTSPSDIRVIGAKGIERDMLSLVWSGHDGAMTAKLLLQMTEEELKLLSISGMIRSSECAHISVELFNILGDEDQLFLVAIRQAINKRNFTWDVVLDMATVISDEKEKYDDLLADKRKEALRPFDEEIRSMVSACWTFIVGASGVNSQLGQSARQRGLESYLENFTITHGSLP